jgi:hypothetical protein
MAWTDLKNYVGAPDSDDVFVETCYDDASSIVLRFIGQTFVPVNIVTRATLEVGSELYHRRSAPNGIAQFSTFDGTPIRVARDPMIGAYPLLNRYVGLGVA